MCVGKEYRVEFSIYGVWNILHLGVALSDHVQSSSRGCAVARLHKLALAESGLRDQFSAKARPLGHDSSFSSSLAQRLRRRRSETSLCRAALRILSPISCHRFRRRLRSGCSPGLDERQSATGQSAVNRGALASTAVDGRHIYTHLHIHAHHAVDPERRGKGDGQAMCAQAEQQDPGGGCCAVIRGVSEPVAMEVHGTAGGGGALQRSRGQHVLDQDGGHICACVCGG